MILKKLNIFSLICVTLSITACQDIGKGGRMVVDNVRNEVLDTRKTFDRLISYKPEDEEYKPIPYAFCYKVMQDINCYSEPIPEARDRLVGWQGRGDFNVANTKLLPAKNALVRQPREADRRNPIEDVLKKEKPEKAEMVQLEPVFIPEPPEVKEGDEKVVTIKVSEADSDGLY